MEQMIRKQIYLQRRQEALLKRAAKQRGMSQAELIRHALERELGAGAARPVRRETDAFDNIAKFIASRRAHKPKTQPYRWQREDAYEERSSRAGRSSGRG